MKVLVVNGPNMQNLVNRGEKYASSYFQLKKVVQQSAQTLGLEVEFFASDIEGELVQAICRSNHDALIINAAAYSHYSIAIRDAVESFAGKKIEVHMTNVHCREEFRHKSVLSSVVDGTICGFGIQSYVLGLHALKGL